MGIRFLKQVTMQFDHEEAGNTGTSLAFSATNGTECSPYDDTDYAALGGLIGHESAGAFGR